VVPHPLDSPQKASGRMLRNCCRVPALLPPGPMATRQPPAARGAQGRPQGRASVREQNHMQGGPALSPPCCHTRTRPQCRALIMTPRSRPGRGRSPLPKLSRDAGCMKGSEMHRRRSVSVTLFFDRLWEKPENERRERVLGGLDRHGAAPVTLGLSSFHFLSLNLHSIN